MQFELFCNEMWMDTCMELKLKFFLNFFFFCFKYKGSFLISNWTRLTNLCVVGIQQVNSNLFRFGCSLRVF